MNARIAWAAFIQAAGEIATKGSFDGLAPAKHGAHLNAFFKDDRKSRQ